jgi:hypothetical protein
MKKEILVGLLPIGFIFAGVVSAGAAAVTWTIVEDASFAMQSPGADGLLGTGDDGFTWCNMDPVGDCETVGYPTKGSLSYAELTFKMASSCPGTGQSCTSNTDCIDTPCVPCSPNPGLIYLGLNPGGGDKGLGTYTVDACENGFDVTKVAIGTSEVVPPFGGGCMVLDTFNSSTGCGVGTASTNYDLTLWTSMDGDCGFPTGIMPGLALSGKIMAATSTTTACGYTAGELSSIASAAGLGEGDYLSVMCGSGTLPTDLKSACIAGADWQAIIVASTSAGIAGACAGACGGVGCLAGTAEGVE